MTRRRISAWLQETIAMQMQHGRYAPTRQLCPRTVCLYKPGVSIPGVFCRYAYTGKMPCTGPQVCHMCGGCKRG